MKPNKFSAGALKLLITALILSFQGCSAGKSSAFIPIPALKLPTIELNNPSSDKNSFMELKVPSGTMATRGYVATLRSCGYSEKASLRGTTRQIFVGLEKLKILGQGPVEFPPHRLWSVEAEAESEGSPIFLSTYTLKREGCFIDFVLWGTPPSEDHQQNDIPEQIAKLRAQFRIFVEEFLQVL